MMESTEKKPYNEVVGVWLRFLKELRYYFYCEGEKRLSGRYRSSR